eukprot:Hpha_TRINITY_DN11960_c0_g1::TRINITY_DN11960_c0_g1_i1::g.20886::m.20886
MERIDAFFCSGELTSALRDFLEDGEGGGAVELLGLEEEQPLHNHEAFRRYGDMMESLLGRFLSEEGISNEEVVKLCRVEDEEGTGLRFLCVEFILATVEYSLFLQIVADHRAATSP